MDVIVRRAEIRDITDLMKMNDLMNKPGISTEAHMKEALEKNQNEIVFVAVHGDRAVGMICGQIHPSVCYAHGMMCEAMELYVCEEYRRMGVATELMERLEQEFEQYNPLEVYLQTGKRNVNAQKLYEKNGYVARERVVYLKNKGG